MERKIKPIRLLPVSFFTAACGITGTQTTEQPPAITQPHQTSPAELSPVNPGGFLALPFPPDPNMKIQRGWTYTSRDGRTISHRGIDYVNEKPDTGRTWLTFPVLTPADGLACLNPPHREGTAAFIQHEVNGRKFFSYLGHLENPDPSIPDCEDENGKPISDQNKKPVKRGEKIGDAGSTGMISDDLTHLHWGVNDWYNRPIDPYGLNTGKEAYPDPNFTNGKFCGQRSLLLDCSTTAVTNRPHVLGITIEPTPLPIITIENLGPEWKTTNFDTGGPLRGWFQISYKEPWLTGSSNNPARNLYRSPTTEFDSVSTRIFLEMEAVNERTNIEIYKKTQEDWLGAIIDQRFRESKAPPPAKPRVLSQEFTAGSFSGSGYLIGGIVPDGTIEFNKSYDRGVLQPPSIIKDVEVNMFVFIRNSIGFKIILHSHPTATKEALKDFKEIIQTFRSRDCPRDREGRCIA